MVSKDEKIKEKMEVEDDEMKQNIAEADEHNI